MQIEQWQKIVDEWIKTYGVRYFDEKTNMLVLTEEVGELAKLMARQYGEQSFKRKEDESNAQEKIGEELADVFFVLTCLANQMGYDLKSILVANMAKKTNRDKERHLNNPKLS